MADDIPVAINANAAIERGLTASITRSATFEAAHFLPNVGEFHKCRKLHGHSYSMTVEVTGTVDGTTGMVRDFADIGARIDGIAKFLDHTTLNDLPGLDNPTSEVLCAWVWDALIDFLPDLSAVTVCETAKTSCTLRAQ